MIQQSLFALLQPATPDLTCVRSDIDHAENLLYSLPRSLVLLWEQRNNPDSNSSSPRRISQYEAIVDDAFFHGLIDDEEMATFFAFIRNYKNISSEELVDYDFYPSAH